MDKFAGSGFIHTAVNQYSDTIIRIAFQYIRSRADAEDIMQEVFISLINQPPFTDEEYLKAWIIRVTINKCKNYLKMTKRRKEVALDFAENNLTESQAGMLEELQELSADDRNIIYLFYYEGYPAKQIAEMLQKKEKAILMRLSRARGRLRHLLEEKT